MTKELQVYVNDTPVGRFSTELQRDGNTSYTFEYLEEISEDNLVSLRMPVTNSPYQFNTFPPAFDMILPEGERKIRIQAFKKIMDTDPFSLLAFVGNNAVNRVRFIADNDIDTQIPDLPTPSAIESCKDGFSLFEELRNAYNENQGISGVMPKILGRSLNFDGSPKAGPSSVNRILHGSNRILKASTEKYPFLGANESLCLGAYHKANLDVPKYTMSSDGTLLQVERFDMKSQEEIDPTIDTLIYRGFEEAASLLGEIGDNKYRRDYGTMISEIEDVIEFDQQTKATNDLIKSIVMNWMLGNGDAHLKNYGVLYDNPHNASLSPFYDVVCTRAYIPDDIPALALSEEHYSKAQWPEDKLREFAMEYGYFSKKELEQMFEECRQAISDSVKELKHHIDVIPGFESVGNAMLSVWEESLSGKINK